MPSLYTCALVAASVASAAAGSSDAQIGPNAAPFPDSVYPEAKVAYAVAGAKNLQKSPPRYPSPWMDGSGDWADAHRRAQDFVRSLTLAEKVNLTTGVGWEGEQCVGQTGAIPRLGFRSLCLQDSPMGVRFADYVSNFPAGGTIAASWDRDLMYRRGGDMAEEHRGKGVDVQLGPVVGPLGRAPAGGRGWEGFSPDPYLSGQAVAATVRGIQSTGIMACTKHLVGNEQEHFRQVGEAVGYGYNITHTLSSNIDDKTMHELYLWPFADAVRAGTASVMCAYTQVNNSQSCQNSYLLNHLLKGELGFQGFVMSDWQAQASGVAGALAGLEMAMPGDTLFDTGDAYYGTNLTIAVLNGTVPEWRVDDMATRIMAGYYYVGRDRTERAINFDSWTTDTYGFRNFYANAGYGLINEHVDVRADHGAHIREFAAKSTVLLKNARGTLPLSPRQKFTGVFGEDAGASVWGPNGCPDRGCDNGTLAAAWGSGSADFPYLVTPLRAIENEIAAVAGQVQGITDNWATQQIQRLAAQVSLALVFVNADSGEGFISVDGNEGDRQNLTLWNNADVLVRNVSALCNNTVVVIHSTGPVLLDSFYDNDNVTAIVWAGLPGQESGNSIADVLYGRVNPGGKLPFTMGRSRRDYGVDVLYQPNNGAGAPQDNFEEGVFVDYRGFDRRNVTPIYEFGYGLSYTTFAYSDLRIVARDAKPYAPMTGRTSAAPVLGEPGPVSDYVWSNASNRVYAYIYPWLNSTDLKASSGDKHYGEPVALPKNARNGAPQPYHPAGGAPGGNPLLYETLYTVYAKVTNTGSVAGDEVAQLYVGLGGPDEPARVLRGFDRLSIEPGQTVTFGADLTYRDLANWDVATQNWVLTKYQKTVFVGASSRQLALSAPIPLAAPYKTEL